MSVLRFWLQLLWGLAIAEQLSQIWTVCSSEWQTLKERAWRWSRGVLSSWRQKQRNGVCLCCWSLCFKVSKKLWRRVFFSSFFCCSRQTWASIDCSLCSAVVSAGLSVWGLLVLPMPVWIFSGCFFPQSRGRLATSKLSSTLCFDCLIVFVLAPGWTAPWCTPSSPYHHQVMASSPSQPLCVGWAVTEDEGLFFCTFGPFSLKDHKNSNDKITIPCVWVSISVAWMETFCQTLSCGLEKRRKLLTYVSAYAFTLSKILE